MNTKHLVAAAAAGVAMAVLHAGTNTWTGAENDWNWNASGNFSGGVPAAADVVLIPDGVTARILGADAASLTVINALERIIPLGSNSLLHVETDASHDVTLSIPVAWPVSKVSSAEAGYGEVVKKGDGRLVLTASDPFAYCTSFTVEKGVLRLPETAKSGVAYGYDTLVVSNGATLFTVGSRGYTFVRELLGSGLVTNDCANVCNMQIWGGSAEAPVRVEATIGGNVCYYSPGIVDILSTNNTMSTDTAVRRMSVDGTVRRGVAGLAKLGNSGSPGSPGKASYLCYAESGGAFRYLGKGEKTTKGLLFKNEDRFAGAGEFDGGPYGGLEFLSTAWSARYGIRNLVLSGSNAVPCVVSSPINVNSTSATNFITLTKRGTGSWRLAHSTQRNGLAGVSVEEGTLQVESIMEKGEMCALGPATNRYQAGYCGAVDPGKRADYSIALGAADSGDVPLLELVGTNGAWTAERDITLFGDARLKNSAANADGEALPMRISGISGASAGSKTLFLEGARTGVEDSVGTVSDGAGRVAVVKMGDGTWSLTGTNTFTGGLIVSNGTLNIISPSGMYTWYRWNVKQIKNGGGEIRMHEFGLYDVDGNRVNGNLARCRTYSAIRRGEAAVQRQMTVYYGEGQSSRELDNLFDDSSTTTYWYFLDLTPGAKYPAKEVPESWYRVLMCLPAGAAEVASYDVAPVNAGGNVVAVAWSLEGSVDGMNWDEVDVVDSTPFTSDTKWMATKTDYTVGSATTHTGGRAIAGSTNKAARALSPECPVEVVRGAVLKCVGRAELANLAVDCGGAGMPGTLDGFMFAASGTINVRGVPNGGVELPLSFADTDASEVAKIAGWGLCVDGKPSSKFKIAMVGGKLRIFPVGTVFIVR